MQQEYLENITSVSEIIPDLGNIVSEYTGGICDVITEEGSQCWYNHFGCDHYCFQNLDSWLYNFIENIENDNRSIIIQDEKNEYNNHFSIINLPITRKKLTLKFSENLIKIATLDLDYDFETILLNITLNPKYQWNIILPQETVIPNTIEFNYISQNKNHFYFMRLDKKINGNKYITTQWIYPNVIVPLVDFIVKNINTLYIEAEYLMTKSDTSLTNEEMKQLQNENNLNINFENEGSVPNYLVGVGNIIPVGYANFIIYHNFEGMYGIFIDVESKSSFTIQNNTKIKQ